jgi:hypothetical protein
MVVPMPIDPESKASELAPLVASELLQAAQRGGNEADFRRAVARVLENAGAAAGLTILSVRDEYRVTVLCPADGHASLERRRNDLCRPH